MTTASFYLLHPLFGAPGGAEILVAQQAQFFRDALCHVSRHLTTRPRCENRTACPNRFPFPRWEIL